MSRPVIKAIKPITVREMIRDSKNKVKSCTSELKMFGVLIRYMIIKISRTSTNVIQMMQTVVSPSYPLYNSCEHRVNLSMSLKYRPFDVLWLHAMSSLGTSRLKNFREYTTMIMNSMIRIVLITRATKNRSDCKSLYSILMTIRMLERTGSLKMVFERTINRETVFRM